MCLIVGGNCSNNEKCGSTVGFRLKSGKEKSKSPQDLVIIGS